MVRVRMKTPLSQKTLKSIGVEPYRDWDEEEQILKFRDASKDSIQITPNSEGKISRPYSVD